MTDSTLAAASPWTPTTPYEIGQVVDGPYPFYMWPLRERIWYRLTHWGRRCDNRRGLLQCVMRTATE